MILSIINNGSLVNNTQNWHNRLHKDARRFRILVSKVSNRTLDFRESDVESNIWISNRSCPYCDMWPKSSYAHSHPRKPIQMWSIYVRICHLFICKRSHVESNRQSTIQMFICNAEFMMGVTLKEHINSHTDELPTIIKCVIDHSKIVAVCRYTSAFTVTNNHSTVRFIMRNSNMKVILVVT